MAATSSMDGACDPRCAPVAYPPWCHPMLAYDGMDGTPAMTPSLVPFPMQMSADWSVYYNMNPGLFALASPWSPSLATPGFSAPHSPAMAMTVATNNSAPNSTMAPTNAANGKKRVYTHNPYASGSDSASAPTTPIQQPSNASFNASSESSAYAAAAYAAPVYALETQYSEAVTNPVSFSLTEQFNQSIGNLCALACSPRGKHLLVSVMRLQHLDKIQTIFDELLANISAVSLDVNGCHVVRSLIEFLQEDHITQLAKRLDCQLASQLATCSQHTRRILQTIFECHHGECVQPIVDSLCVDAPALARTQQGCIALMRVLENSTPLQKEQMLACLTPVLADLAIDPFANYVVQTIVQHFDREKSSEIVMQSLQGRWITLACNKYASNVMEKIIHDATPTTRRAIVEDLCMTPQNLHRLTQDGYGNFVLQALIETCTSAVEYKRVSELVRPLLHSSPYGHKIDARLKSKRFCRDSQDVPASTDSTTTAARQRRCWLH